MNDEFRYSGKVTIKSIWQDRIVHSQHFNNGTELLFKAYSMAMAGYDITELLPSFINVGYISDNKFESVMTNEDGVSVTRTYTNARINESDEPRPITRVTTTFTRNMFNNKLSGNSNSLRLHLDTLVKNSDGNNTLAQIELSDDESNTFRNLISNSSPGTQIIIVWDLYIRNA